MKEIKNSISYTLKGELVSFENEVLTAVGKKGEEDFIDFEELLKDIKVFSEQNLNKGVVISFSATSVE